MPSKHKELVTMSLLFCLKRWETLKLFACWVFFHALVQSAGFFQNSLFSKNSFSNTIRSGVLNHLDPDQDRHSVGPDLGTNCSQR